AMIGATAMALRHSLDLQDAADKVEAASESVRDSGLRTADIAAGDAPSCSTNEMTTAVIDTMTARF
ncbi:MAG: 3-isopropylmalate dehydrogenase, partial [Acidimicrobiia bacterium]|nr:3-isopropylmalate dehydrogenase [Acidimicrobiia bacterium]